MNKTAAVLAFSTLAGIGAGEALHYNYVTDAQDSIAKVEVCIDDPTQLSIDARGVVNCSGVVVETLPLGPDLKIVPDLQSTLERLEEQAKDFSIPTRITLDALSGILGFGIAGMFVFAESQYWKNRVRQARQNQGQSSTVIR